MPDATAHPGPVAVPPAPGGDARRRARHRPAGPWPRSTTSACCTCAPRARACPGLGRSSRSWRRSAVPTASPPGAPGVGLALARGLGAGRPAWASDWWVPAFAARAAQVAAGWRPDVIQAEFHVMGQYLEPLRRVRRPGAGRARARRRGGPRPRGRGARPGAGRPARGRPRLAAVRAPDPDLRRRGRRAHRARPRRAHRAGGPSPVARIPFGADLPAEPLDPLGTDPPRIVFVGNLNHPPNAQAALDLGARSPTAAPGLRTPSVEVVGRPAPRALRPLGGPRRIVVARRGRGRAAPRPRRPSSPGPAGRRDAREGRPDARGRQGARGDRPGSRGPRPRAREHALVAETDYESSPDRIVELLDDPERRGRVAAARARVGGGSV